jgi:hypothetical protein
LYPDSFHLHPLPSDREIAHLEKTVQEIRNQFATFLCTSNQEKDSLNETINSLRADLRAEHQSSNSKVTHPEHTVQELNVQHNDSHYKTDHLTRTIRAHKQMNQYESLYLQGCIYDAAESLLAIATTIGEDIRADKLVVDRLAERTHQCATKLERVGGEASNAEKHDEVVSTYSTALSLSPSTPHTVLVKWASVMLVCGSTNEALNAAAKFKLPRVFIYRVMCDMVEGDGRITEAIECFRRMQSELSEDTSMHDERAQWERGGWLQR